MRKPTKGNRSAARSITGPGSGGGGGAADPVALAETLGFGYWDFSDAGNYVTGASGLYQLLDQTGSGHVGTLSDRSGTGGSSNTVQAGSGLGTGYCRVAGASGDRCMWLNAPPVSNELIMVVVFRTVGATGNGQFEGPWTHQFGSPGRPGFIFNQSGTLGNWTLNTGGGGAGDTTNQSEASNVAHTNNPIDNDWHCVALHHGSSLFEGLMMDLDGEQLVDTAGLTHNDHGTMTSFCCFCDDQSLAGGGGSNLHTMDIGAIAWGTDEDVIAHSQTRSLASELMSAFGITDLSP